MPADFVNYTIVPSGDRISTDKITLGGLLTHLQRMKIGIGPSGSYQQDLSFGAATTAASIPVTIATDQIVPTYNNLGNKATYFSSSNGTITPSTIANTTTSLAYLWHPNTSTKRVTLQKLLITWAAGTGSGDFRLALARITAENGVPGGTSQTINKEDQDDAASGCTFRTSATGAPTRAAGDYVTMNFSITSDGSIELTDILEGKGFICRASQSEGWEIRFITGTTTPTTTPALAVTFVWAEQ